TFVLARYAGAEGKARADLSLSSPGLTGRSSKPGRCFEDATYLNLSSPGLTGRSSNHWGVTLKEHVYYVYILASGIGGTLYIGVTNNLVRRVYEHRETLAKGFTKTYDVTRLVYYEQFGQIDLAIQREHRLKKWNRAWKIELIEERNPNWVDLYPS